MPVSVCGLISKLNDLIRILSPLPELLPGPGSPVSSLPRSRCLSSGTDLCVLSPGMLLDGSDATIYHVAGAGKVNRESEEGEEGE